MDDKRQDRESKSLRIGGEGAHLDSFVLAKGIFSNIFEKDIRRVYIYKKAERLAKAIHLVTPAFRQSPPLKERLGTLAIGLVDAAILPPLAARDALSRELLALSSILSMARTGGFLSSMNADLIAREAHLLLEEVATYEEPRLSFDDVPSLASLARASHSKETKATDAHAQDTSPREANKGQRIPKGQTKGQTEDPRTSSKDDRRTAIEEVLKAKGPSYIKDISTVIRNVSEKTIQRELQVLVQEGRVTRSGERRWTTYALST